MSMSYNRPSEGLPRVWEDLVAIDARRHQPGLAALRGRLYVVGGENKQHRLHSGEAYDPITNKWSPIADLNEGRSHFALAALKGKLYAFGGRGVNGELHSIEVYDPRTDEWTWADDLPWPMHELKAVTYNDAVYLMHKQSLLRYRPPQGEWRTCAKRYVVRADCGAAVLGDQLYVVGGSGDEYDALDIVERYSFATTTRRERILYYTEKEGYVGEYLPGVREVHKEQRRRLTQERKQENTNSPSWPNFSSKLSTQTIP
ncbi:Kelch-like protein 13 [Eumeta japonica]|uniref:Kelch-like protein 13 n=1 Tax=Eumeta variegata TaxID=151549 RepID=A0A4C1WIQ8_EUMVA|nr:Kelch-like protein 13 [Eumeta japonica]